MAVLVTTIRLWDHKAQKHVDREVRVEVDLAKIARTIGGKAHANKSKVTKMVHGAVCVYAVTRNQ